MQFRSKNLTHFTDLYLLNIIKKILPQHSQKHVSGWYQEQKLCCIDAQNLHSRSTWKALPLYDCKYQFEKFCSRNVESIIISFRVIAFWGSWNVLLFSFSILLSIVLKYWDFPDNLDFKSRTVVKDFLRSHFLSVVNNMTVKQHISHGAIKKYVTCIMGAFTPLACHTFSILLCHLPCVIH